MILCCKAGAGPGQGREGEEEGTWDVSHLCRHQYHDIQKSCIIICWAAIWRIKSWSRDNDSQASQAKTQEGYQSSGSDQQTPGKHRWWGSNSRILKKLLRIKGLDHAQLTDISWEWSSGGARGAVALKEDWHIISSLCFLVKDEGLLEAMLATDHSYSDIHSIGNIHQ